MMRFLMAFLVVLLVLAIWQYGQFGYHSIGRFSTRAAAHAQAVEHLDFWYYLIMRDIYKIEYSYLENGTYKREAMWYFKDRKRLGLEEDFGSGYSKLWPDITRPKLKQLMAQIHQGIPINGCLGQTIVP